MAARRADAPLKHRKIRAARRRDLGARRKQDGHVEALGQIARRADRDLVPPDEERHAPAFHRHHVEGGGRLGGGGDDRGHLRAREARLGRPARRLADIGEGKRLLGALCLGDLAKERRLLRAGHGDGLARRKCGAEPLEPRPTELMRRRLAATSGACERRAIGRHRAFAGATQHDPVGHRHGALLASGGRGLNRRAFVIACEVNFRACKDRA